MKFKIKKRFKFTSLGEEWKDCYLDFYPFTSRDLEGDIATLIGMDTKDTKQISEASKKVLNIISERFIAGKMINEQGLVIDITKEDMPDIPLTILQEVIGFLSEASVEKK